MNSRRSQRPVILFLGVVVVLILLQAFFVKLYAVPSASMEPLLNSSQSPGLGDRILVNRLAYMGVDPSRNDVVVFRKSADWWASTANESASVSDSFLVTALRGISEFTGIGPGLGGILVKRVIAGPGDVVSCCSLGGQIAVNGVPLTEPYVQNDFPFDEVTLNCSTDPISMRCFEGFTVPAGKYIVLGDNRSDSSDSLAQCRGKTDAAATCVRYADRSDIIGRVFAVFDFPSRPLFFI